MTGKREALPIYRAQYGLYDRVVAVSSEAEARKLLGSPDVHLYGDQDFGRRIKRRPGLVFRKLLGVKRKVRGLVMRKTKTEDCTHCEHSGWVCEDHTDKPMLRDDCAGAGIPCAACAVPMREAA